MRSQGFQSKLTSSATSVQGSGWAWLGYCKERDTVKVVTTANQDPCVTTGLIPLLGIDVSVVIVLMGVRSVLID